MTETAELRTAIREEADGSGALSIVLLSECSFSENRPRVPRWSRSTPEEEAGPGTELLESIRAPFKPKADIVLVGNAHAPGGRPVKAMDVSIRVGSLQKRLRVLGDRRWQFGSALAMVPKPTDPEPFTSMPLTYDRAFGGIDEASASWYPQNPTGRGYIGTKTKEAVHEKPLPNIEDPSDPVTSWESKPKLPAGFGFYGRGWQPRVKHAGTWDPEAKEHTPDALPKDFSPAFFNAAHPHLQVEGYLRGDEEVELQGVSPQGALRFRLPGIRPTIRLARWAVDPMQWLDEQAATNPSVSVDDIPVREEVLSPVLDTLVLLPDEGIYYEVFRAVVPLKSLDTSEIARIRVEDGDVGELSPGSRR